MTMRELLAKVKALEAKVAELEARPPVVIRMPPPTPPQRIYGDTPFGPPLIYWS